MPGLPRWPSALRRRACPTARAARRRAAAGVRGWRLAERNRTEPRSGVGTAPGPPAFSNMTSVAPQGQLLLYSTSISGSSPASSKGLHAPVSISPWPVPPAGRAASRPSDHDRRCLERAGPGAVLLERQLVRLPPPDEIEPAHVGNRDVPGRRVVGVRPVGADLQPFDHGARVPGIRKGSRRKGDGGNRSLHGTGLRSRAALRLCGPAWRRRPEDTWVRFSHGVHRKERRATERAPRSRRPRRAFFKDHIHC